ncbi:MAG TPA: SufE family protein [Bacteroidota bacterium]|nr:SufE family protein [Bacteroidota bacterium]
MSAEPHIPDKLRELLESFDGVTGREDRMALLASYADRFTPVPPAVAVRPYPEANRIAFCESEAYVWGVPRQDGTMKFYFAVENPSGVSAKALGAILDRTLSGAPLEEVAEVTPEIVTRLFRQNISMGKGMGLSSLVERVRVLAEKATHSKQSTP